MCREARLAVQAAVTALTLFSSASLAQRATAVDWETLLKDFEPHVKAAFPANDRHRREVRIYCTADVTGDSIDEAVVTLGYGGAYTEAVTLLRVESGAPVVTRLRSRDGREFPVNLLKGASAMNLADFELRPNDLAISDIECRMASNADPNVSETASCTADSFVWNDQTKLFEYDAVLSERVAGEYYRRRREQETSKYIPSPNQRRVLRECGEGIAGSRN